MLRPKLETQIHDVCARRICAARKQGAATRKGHVEEHATYFDQACRFQIIR